ncbi:MAG: TadE/TadG family type IV pilus assembly protein [Hyphomicrobiaceae bacterium]
MSVKSKLSKRLCRALLPVKRLGRDREGFAAVEFAMIVPIMVVMFLGSVEFTEALSVDRRVTAIASATADLVAQSEEVSTSDLQDIMQIANSLLNGVGDVADLRVTIISVSSDDEGNVTVDWSYGNRQDNPVATGSSYSDLPVGLLANNESVIVSTVTYRFTPKISHFITGRINLSETFYLRPRHNTVNRV